MKKLILISIALIAVFSLTACTTANKAITKKVGEAEVSIPKQANLSDMPVSPAPQVTASVLDSDNIQVKTVTTQIKRYNKIQLTMQLSSLMNQEASIQAQIDDVNKLLASFESN